MMVLSMSRDGVETGLGWVGEGDQERNVGGVDGEVPCFWFLGDLTF